MVVQHDAEFLAHRPEAVVVGRVERLDVGRAVVGHVRQQHAAAQSVRRDPAHVGDRLVDVVQVDEADARALLRILGAPVGQPAVVRADALEAQPVVLGPRVAADQHAGLEERRHRVREDHLADDAFLLHVGHALDVVPVLVLLAADVLLLRVLVAAAPGVELVAQRGLEVIAVGLDARAGVGVGGDDDVGASFGVAARHGSASVGAGRGFSRVRGGSSAPGRILLSPPDSVARVTARITAASDASDSRTF